MFRFQHLSGYVGPWCSSKSLEADEKKQEENKGLMGSHFAYLNQVTTFAFLRLCIVPAPRSQGSPHLGSIGSVNQQIRTMRISKIEFLCLCTPVLRSRAKGNRTKGAWFRFPHQGWVGSLAEQGQESEDIAVAKSPWASYFPSQTPDFTVWMIWHSTTESVYWAPVISSLLRMVENTQK